MSQARQDLDHEPTIRRTHLRTRRHRQPGTTKTEGAPLAHLQRRCTGGAVIASCGYLVALITTTARPTALSAPSTFGMLTGFGAVAVLCALGAILAWSDVRHAEHGKASPCDYAVDDIDWAIQFGADLAEAFPDRGAENAAPRGPSIR